MHVGSIIRTDVELFDLPQGAVIRAVNGRIGEIEGEHVADLHAWDFDEDGARTLARRICWTGSDIDTYEHYHDKIATFLPAEVIWVPGGTTCKLSEVDRHIVETVNDQFITHEQVTRAREIHSNSLATLRPQLDAMHRAVAMREYALARLEGL